MLVSGQDADLAGSQRVVEGTQAMTVYKPIKLIAEKAAELAINMASGKPLEKNMRTVNNGKKEVPSLLLVPIQVDKANIDATIVKDGFHSHADIYKKSKL